ncbi:hypothetical protein Tco_0360304 [Tanacetum coccineum]
METHCVNMELKYQNQALKDGQHGQILNETINIELEQSVAKLLAENAILHKENEHLKQTYKDLYNSIKKTRFSKPSILGKPVLQPPRNQSVVRQPNAFKSERPNFLKPRFTSQVDVNNVLSKLVTPHYLPKVSESVFAKPQHVIAPGSSRNSSKESYGSNDMAHNYYLEEAKKKTQDKNRNLKPRKMPSAKTHNTPNACTSKHRSNNQTSRNWPASKSCEEMLKAIQKVDHSRNPSSFSDFKHFVCLTCQKCVFNANHDACIIKFLKEVNSHAKIQPNKTRNSNKPVDPTSHTQKPGRKIVTGHSFSLNKSSAVHEKTNTPRSYLRWIPTGRIFNTAGLKWVPTGKTFTSSTTKVDCELPNGSNDYITNPYKCDQTLNVSAGTLNLSADQHPCFMIMVSVDNTSGPAPQRKEECTLQCALSSKEEKSSCYLKIVVEVLDSSWLKRSIETCLSPNNNIKDIMKLKPMEYKEARSPSTDAQSVPVWLLFDMLGFTGAQCSHLLSLSMYLIEDEDFLLRDCAFIINENLGIHEVVSIIQYFDFESEYLSTQQLAAATSMLGSRVGIYGLLLALP